VIEYSQFFTTVNKPAPVIIKCVIKDNGLIRIRINEAPLLYYRKHINSWSAFSALSAYSSNADTFYFSIPGSLEKAVVEYYFAAQDIALPSPLMTTLPAGGSGINPPGSNPPSIRVRFKVNPFGYSSVNDPENKIQISNFPNPFNPVTKINYELPTSQNGRIINYITIKVYDVLGKEIVTLVNRKQDAGSYEVVFDGKDLPSGVYFYSLESENFRITKQMLLLK